MKTSRLSVGCADQWFIASTGTPIPRMNVTEGRFSDAWPSAWTPFTSAAAGITIEAERQGGAFGITVLRMYPITVPGLFRYTDFMLGHEAARLDTRYLFDRCRVDPCRPDTVHIVDRNWGFYMAADTPKWTGCTAVDYFGRHGKRGV